MKTSIWLTVGFVAMGLSGSSVAQASFLPFSFVGAPEPEAPPTAPEAPSEGGPPKTYPKPTPVELPEGPGKDLSGPVRVVAFDGVVSRGLVDHTIDAIETAEREGDQLVIIELDTPGGAVNATQKLVKAMLSAQIPIVVHVTPKGAHAASAGTFITMAGHVAAMSPATRIGAAHPVDMFGQDPEDGAGEHMAAKVENDLVALATSIAKERHRNAAWAEAAVRYSVSITADRAVELMVVDLVAANREALLETLNGRAILLNDSKVNLQTAGAEVIVHPLSTRNQLLNLLASPLIVLFLFGLGVGGLMIEVYNPGMIVPGVMGLLAFVALFIAMDQLPISVGAGLLVLAGAALLVAETFTPTFGALGLMGIIGLTVGLLLLIDPSDPDFAIDPSVRFTMWDVLPIAGALGAIVAFMSYFVVKVQRSPSVTGSEGLVGATGTVLQPTGPSGGQVFVAGEYWQATASEALDVGTPIRVVKVANLQLLVRRD